MTGDVHERLEDALEGFRQARAGRRGTVRLERALLRECHQAWQTGDRQAKLHALAVLSRGRPRGGEEIVWEALESSDVSLSGNGLAPAIQYVSENGLRPDARGVAALRQVVLQHSDDHIRMAALDLIGQLGLDELDPWVRQLTKRAPHEGVRRQANIILMRKGYPDGKRALFAYLREHPDHVGVADDLWLARDVFHLTRAEERLLRAAIQRWVVSLHARLRDRNNYEASRRFSVAMLGRFAREGFAFEEAAVDDAAQLARAAEEPETRLQVVLALEAFATPRARDVLRELAADGQPREVAREARRALRRLGR